MMTMKKFLSLVLAMMMLCGVCAVSASAEDTIKVGMVTDVGGINDQSFNQFAWEGLKKLEEEDPSFKVQYLESKTDADYQTNINTFIDEEYDLIICVGYMLADATREAAEDNPEQYFAIVDDASIDLPNVACLTFAQEQCSYLVGLIAGYMTQTKTVGYIQGMVSETMNLFGVGYCAGVLEACPEAKILQYNANAFTDIAGGNTAAKDMITNGADVIYHAAGGTGLGMLNACEEEGIWGIGVDSDQAAVTGLNCVLSSALKETGTGAVDIAKSVKEGNFVGGEHHYTVADGAIGYATTGDHIPADVLEKVEAAKAAIISGELVVPTSVDEVPAFTLDD
jgi:basic membrane protein A